MVTNTKPCAACRTPTHRRACPTTGRHTETLSNWRKRQTCGNHTCVGSVSAAHNLNITPAEAHTLRTTPRTCEHCKRAFTRPPKVGPTAFHAQKHCNPTCAQQARIGKPSPKSRYARRHNPIPPPPTHDLTGLTPREALTRVHQLHPLLLQYIASPPRLTESWEIHTHIGYGELEAA